MILIIYFIAIYLLINTFNRSKYIINTEYPFNTHKLLNISHSFSNYHHCHCCNWPVLFPVISQKHWRKSSAVVRCKALNNRTNQRVSVAPSVIVCCFHWLQQVCSTTDRIWFPWIQCLFHHHQHWIKHGTLPFNPPSTTDQPMSFNVDSGVNPMDLCSTLQCHSRKRMDDDVALAV